MGEVCHCPNTLVGLFGMVEELVGIDSDTIHLRCLHYEENSLDMVEEVEERDREKCNELGRCHCICFGSGVFR